MDTSAIQEHMSVVGSDGIHVGVVDHVLDDVIMLTRSDPTADGEHHYIPLAWVDIVTDVVQLRIPGREAMEGWRTEREQHEIDRQRESDSAEDPFAANRARSVGGEVY